MREYNPDISTAHQRAMQEDPWIMYIIVRKDWNGAREHLLKMAARASVQAEAQLGFAYQENFDAWWSESFRKVVLRADEKEWDKVVDELDGAISGPVIACPPIKRSERPKILGRLQALKDMSLPMVNSKPGEMGINFYVLNNISLGKQMAQVAHASMKLAVQQQIEFNQVALMDMTVIYCSDLNSILDTENNRMTVINDAGLTEVDNGTLTVVAEIKTLLEEETLEQNFAISL